MPRFSALALAIVLAVPAHAQEDALLPLIRDLGASEFATRERASGLLTLVGESARAALVAATRSPDAESAARARALLAALDRRAPHPRSALPPVGEAALAALAATSVPLVALDFADRSGPMLAAMPAIAVHGRALRALSFARCDGVDDRVLARTRELGCLTELDLTGCTDVTDAGIEALGSCTTLRRLVVSGCSRVSAPALAAFRRAVPECEVVRTHPRALALYWVKADDAVHVEGTALDALELENEPFLACEHVAKATATGGLALTDAGWKRLPERVSVHGKPFVVAAYDRVVVLAAFWTLVSSQHSELPVLFVEQLERPTLPLFGPPHGLGVTHPLVRAAFAELSGRE